MPLLENQIYWTQMEKVMNMLTYVTKFKMHREKRLINLCKENSLAIANHLKFGNKTLGGNLSYKNGNKWISELDLCLVHNKAIPLIKEVTIRQDIKGSDHPPPLCIYGH